MKEYKIQKVIKQYINQPYFMSNNFIIFIIKKDKIKLNTYNIHTFIIYIHFSPSIISLHQNGKAVNIHN